MGTGEKTANRRALIEKVKDCVAQTNAITTLATEVREAHNLLAEKTSEDVKRLDGRLDTVGKWCARNEGQARAAREDQKWSSFRQETFTLMTFWHRFRWLLTGVLPNLGEGFLDAARHPPGPVPSSPSPAERDHIRSEASLFPGPVRLHGSSGPRVLP